MKLEFAYLFELSWDDLEALMALDDLNLQITEQMFKVRVQFLCLPVAKLRVSVLVVPYDH